MIKVKELRIGNYVMCALKTDALHTDFIGRIRSIHKDAVNIQSELCTDIFEDEIYPIPLTEELLLKCGFKNKCEGVENWYEKPMPSIGCLIWIKDKGYLTDVSEEILNIRYMHQLQNLHFAITGKELELPVL